MAVDACWERWVEPTIGEILQREGYPQGCGYAELFSRMDSYGDRLAVTFEGSERSYAELLRMTASVADYLRGLGIRRGDRVGLMSRGHDMALASHLGVIASGAVLVPLYSELEGDPLASALERFGIRAVLADDLTRERLELLQDATELEFVVDIRGPEFGQAIGRGGDVQRMIGEAPTTADPVMILSTSGTTGEPKGVVQSSAFASAALIGAAKWRIDEPLKSYCSTSFGHGAISFATSMAFWAGGSVVIAARFSASRFWEDATTHGCNYVHLVGTMQQMLFNQPPKPADSRHTVRYCGSGGMPPAIWAAFEQRFGVRVMEMFSATDSGGLALGNAGQYPPGALRPWNDFEARVVDEDDAPVPVGTVGDLQMRPRGGTASVSYYDDPEASLAKVRGGWLSFGDNFRQDDSGNYFFHGRGRDLIRRRGVNFAPNSIEDVYVGKPGVELVTAFGVPSDLGEDEVKLVAVTSAAGGHTVASLRALADSHLPAHMRPRYIELVDELPMTPGTQRVIKRRLQESWRTPTTWDCETATYLDLD